MQVEERHAARAVVHLSLPYLYTELGDASGASAADFTYLRVAQGSPLHHEAAFPRLPAGSSGLHAARWPSMAQVGAKHPSMGCFSAMLSSIGVVSLFFPVALTPGTMENTYMSDGPGYVCAQDDASLTGLGLLIGLIIGRWASLGPPSPSVTRISLRQ